MAGSIRYEEKGHEEKGKLCVYSGGTDCGGCNPVHTFVYRGAYNMMNYINAAHEATAQTEARICVDAVQRYLNDEKEKGKLTGGMLLRLMGLDLSNSDGPLKDYISGGQKGARIVSVEADLATGRLQVLKYENRYCTVKLNIDEDGNITEASD